MLSLVALAPSGLAISTAPAAEPAVRARDLLRSDVLSLLPKGAGAPAIASGALLAAVEELELQGVTPASPEFLSLALGAGAWELRAIGPADGAAAPSASELVQINGVECRVDGERIRTSTSFALADEELVGSLEASAAWSSTTRADTLHLVADGLELSMPRAPAGCGVPALVGELLQSSHVAADEGAKFSLQTTHLDEGLWVARCLTRHLYGAIGVYVRADC